MSRALYKKLAPSMRKLMLRADDHRLVGALVQVAPARSTAEVSDEVRNLGARVTSVLDEPHMLTVELEVAQLPLLADIDGIVYIEGGDQFGT